MNIQKLKSGNYRARVFLGKDENGKRLFHSITAPTKKEAMFLAAQYENEKHKYNNNNLNSAIEIFLSKNKDTLSETTYGTYCTYHKNRFQSLMDLPIDKITTEVIQKAINEEQKVINARTHKPLTVDYIKKCLVFIFDSMHEVDSSVRFSIKDFKFRKEEDKEYNVPDPEQMKEIREAIRGTKAELPILLASQMSLRTSELRGLQWDDVDLKNGWLHVRRAKVLRNTVKECKTKTSKRIIPLTPEVAELFKQYPKDKDSKFIFNVGKNFIYDQFTEALAEKNMPHWTVHAMRHYFASFCLLSEVPDRAIEALGGWSPNSSVMKKVYQSVYDQAKLNAMNKMYGLVDTKVDTQK